MTDYYHMCALAFGLLFLVAGFPSQAQLSGVERKLVDIVDRNNPEALRLWEQVVNINSGTMNFKGVRQVGAVFQARLDALGFLTRWVDGTQFNRAGHLLAEHYAKKKGKTILPIGHLDTVFEPSSPFQKFEVIDEGTVRGPGVGDMKGGDVVMIQALTALKQAGVLDDMNIIVYLGGDEELSGDPLSLARKDLIEAASKAQIAIGFEDGDGHFETVNISRRSVSGWELRIAGTPAHSSQIFTHDIGAGAVFEAARILNAFYNTLSNEHNLTFNPGVILGGTDVKFAADSSGGEAFGKDNVVAGTVVVAGDIRAISPEQLEKARTAMREIVSNNLPGTRAELVFHDGYPPMAPTEGNHKLLTWFDKASHDLGYGAVRAVNPRDAGAADISFAAAHVDMAMDGLGLRSAGGHTTDETADPRTLPMQTKRTAVLLYRIAFDKVAE